MFTMTTAQKATRPAITPVKSSVLDHATVVTVEQFGLSNNEGLWPSYNCLDMLTPTPICPDPEREVKTFGRAEWQPGLEQAVYGGVQCSLVGLDVADQKAEVERVFALSEGKGVERLLLSNRFVAKTSSPGSPAVWDAPVDLSPASDVGVVVALALLEGYAGRVYAGRPTIHMPIAAATVLEASGLIVWNGDLAFTKNGSKVAMGGGYDDEDMLASGAWDLYATGEVYVEKAPNIEVNQFVTGPAHLYHNPPESDDPNEFDDNTSVVLAERMMRVAIDCFVAKCTAVIWS